MHPIPKPTPQDKPTLSQWNSTIKRRLVPQVRHQRTLRRGAITCRPRGHKDPRDWTGPVNRSITAQRYRKERRRFPGLVKALYGDQCLHPVSEGLLCGQAPAEAHHCHFGRRSLKGAAQQDPRQGTVLCQAHHNGGADCPHACTTPWQGEQRRAHWEEFATIAMTEGPEAALAWNRQTRR